MKHPMVEAKHPIIRCIFLPGQASRRRALIKPADGQHPLPSGADDIPGSPWPCPFGLQKTHRPRETSFATLFAWLEVEHQEDSKNKGASTTSGHAHVGVSLSSPSHPKKNRQTDTVNTWCGVLSFCPPLHPPTPPTKKARHLKGSPFPPPHPPPPTPK